LAFAEHPSLPLWRSDNRLRLENLSWKNMNILEEHGNFRIECSREELIVLSNALNNIPQAVDEQEYTTLIGASKTDAHKVLDAIVKALNTPSD
jgi:hypothetical protein